MAKVVVDTSAFADPELDIRIVAIWLSGFPTNIYEMPFRVFKDFITDKAGLDNVEDINWDKIGAVRTLLMNDLFWNEWHIFEKIILVANSVVPRFDLVQPPSIEEVAFGITVVNEIRKEPFDREIKRYLSALCMYHDYFFVPVVSDLIDRSVLPKEINDLIDKCESTMKKLKNKDFKKVKNPLIKEQLRRYYKTESYINEKQKLYVDQKTKYLKKQYLRSR